MKKKKKKKKKNKKKKRITRELTLLLQLPLQLCIALHTVDTQPCHLLCIHSRTSGIPASIPAASSLHI